MDETKCIRAIVTGTVHGVFFRASTLEQAQSLGLVGSVQNLSDETVQIIAQGSTEALEDLLRWAHLGPPAATVTHVVIQDQPVDDGLRTFSVIR